MSLVHSLWFVTLGFKHTQKHSLCLCLYKFVQFLYCTYIYVIMSGLENREGFENRFSHPCVEFVSFIFLPFKCFSLSLILFCRIEFSIIVMFDFDGVCLLECGCCGILTEKLFSNPSANSIILEMYWFHAIFEHVTSFSLTIIMENPKH